MTRILIVDDEENIREVVREYAELNGYDADEAQDGFEAIDKVKNGHYDCIILDVMMPRLDGFSACREIRKVSESPIIILSARTEEYDKLFGFELGVDDYVVKPFSPKELMARIRVILERVKKHTAQDILKFEGLVIDVPGRSVSVDGKKAPLTPKEIDAAYEKNTGLVIIETFEERGLNPMHTPGVLCKNHGPFTWGKDAAEAVHNAVVLEEVAKMATKTELINPG